MFASVRMHFWKLCHLDDIKKYFKLDCQHSNTVLEKNVAKKKKKQENAIIYRSKLFLLDFGRAG